MSYCPAGRPFCQGNCIHLPPSQEERDRAASLKSQARIADALEKIAHRLDRIATSLENRNLAPAESRPQRSWLDQLLALDDFKSGFKREYEMKYFTYCTERHGPGIKCGKCT